MKFKKDFLRSLAWDNYNKKEVKVIKTELVDTSRWSIHYNQIFEFQDKFYSTNYSVGATESQDETPYEYDGDEIECNEVVPIEKIIITYETVK